MIYNPWGKLSYVEKRPWNVVIWPTTELMSVISKNIHNIYLMASFCLSRTGQTILHFDEAKDGCEMTVASDEPFPPHFKQITKPAPHPRFQAGLMN